MILCCARRKFAVRYSPLNFLSFRRKRRANYCRVTLVGENGFFLKHFYRSKKQLYQHWSLHIRHIHILFTIFFKRIYNLLLLKICLCLKLVLFCLLGFVFLEVYEVYCYVFFSCISYWLHSVSMYSIVSRVSQVRHVEGIFYLYVILVCPILNLFITITFYPFL